MRPAAACVRRLRAYETPASCIADFLYTSPDLDVRGCCLPRPVFVYSAAGLAHAAPLGTVRAVRIVGVRGRGLQRLGLSGAGR